MRGYGDLYRLTVETISPLKRVWKMSQKEAEDQVKRILESKGRGLARLLNGLSIRHVGTRVAAVLAERFGSMDSIIAANVEELSKTIEIGPIIAQSVYGFLHDKFGSETIADLKSVGVKMGVPHVRASRSLDGKTIVVTGSLANYSRDEIAETITRHGGHAASSVSKNTDYVLVGENPGSKLEKARSLRVPVITEEEFERLLKG